MVARLGEAELLDIYRGLVRNRLTDITLKRMVRQGVISKAWLGTGEEAVTIGPVHALRRGGDDHDVVAPMIRNGGACHELGMPVADIIRAYMGTFDGPSRRPLRRSLQRDPSAHQPRRRRGPRDHGDRALAARARDGLGRHDVDWRWDHQGGRHARGTQFRRGAPRAGDIHHPEQPGGARHTSRAAPPRRGARRLRRLAARVRDVGRRVRREQRARCLCSRRPRGGALPRGRGSGAAHSGDLPHGRARHARRSRGEADLPGGALRRVGAARPGRAACGRTRSSPPGLGFSREALAAAEMEVAEEVERAEEAALESRKERMPRGESAVTGVYSG